MQHFKILLSGYRTNLFKEKKKYGIKMIIYKHVTHGQSTVDP